MPITKDPNNCSALESLTLENWFCFGGESGKSGCPGDSGGPVIVGENNKNRFTGIVKIKKMYLYFLLGGLLLGLYQVERWKLVVLLVDMGWLWMCTGGLTGSPL